MENENGPEQGEIDRTNKKKLSYRSTIFNIRVCPIPPTMASSLITRLLPHHRHLLPTADTLFAPSSSFFPSSYSSSKNTSLVTKQYGCSNSYHTSPTLHRPGYKPERNPKIKITLEQLRMAARTQGRRLPICHEQQEKVMNSLEAAKYEVRVLLDIDTSCVTDCWVCFPIPNLTPFNVTEPRHLQIR